MEWGSEQGGQVFIDGVVCGIIVVLMCVGLVRTIYRYGVYTVCWAGKIPDIQSYTAFMYDFGQPYMCALL